MSPNRLATATSPYLLQHADNPVDWYEWGQEALQRARSEDKPLLISVGYSACHWCHVMERESFEDEETARLMNEHFVSVKVDREERPDVDAIYMDAVQAMTGHGGWPMTVFVDADGRPFFAGTYFPKEDRHGLPSFRRVLEAVAEAWRDRRGELHEQGERVAGAIASGTRLRPSQEPITEGILREAQGALLAAFDREWGGFGAAPKFPQPMTLEFLLRCELRGYPHAREMVTRTVGSMAAGGIHDHLGGGFHRYSTDQRWLVPHFEKMLYDNAQLARLFVHLWQATGDDRYRDLATETLDYLLREMRQPGGGFSSAQDADSEGVEGKFFVWSRDELLEAAGPGGELVAAWYGATPEGNWEGTNVLWTPRSQEVVADEQGVSAEELRAAVREARPRLLRTRGERVAPSIDDKVLTGWNGLAVAALAEAGRSFGEPRYVEAAEAAAQFVLAELRDRSGRLLRAWRDGRTSGPGFADDHALMGAALLELYQATFEPRWLEESRGLADDLLRLFSDPEGGFFQTGTDQEELVVRPKELFDNAVPSGNSVAADLLQRLAMLTGEVEYERAAIAALRPVRDLMGRAATMLGQALSAADLYLSRSIEVAVAGDPSADDARRLVGEVWRRYLPNAVLAAGDPEDPAAAKAAPLLEGRDRIDGQAAAYVCERFVCRRPVTEPSELARELSIGQDRAT